MRPAEDEDGKKKRKVKQEQVERGEIERPEEDADGRGKMKRGRETARHSERLKDETKED